MRARRLLPCLLVLLAAAPAQAARPPASASDPRWETPANWPFDPPGKLRRGVDGVPDWWDDGSPCAVGCRPRGAHLGWPLKPFHERHALRAGLNELRPSSFHHGIDIQAEDHVKVYAMQSGSAHIVESSGAEERVQVGSYVYWHVDLRVREGQRVRAFRTVLGTTKSGFGHLHLSELSGSRYLNPLRPHGRVLFPWRDSAAPVLARPRVLSDGRVLVEAFDPQSFQIRTRYNTPVLGLAALAYRVLDRDGHKLTGLRWALRGTQNYDWSVHSAIYASDTRAPDFDCWFQPNCKPRWDYVLAGGLAPSVRELGLPSGRYVLKAYGWDWAGNASTIEERFKMGGGARKRAIARPAQLSKPRASDKG
ncbi:MAG TPA: M23 family metallopeptidase [Thermoleophilaceae bacterium]|nr:M23 family metallopeptidase [Thermoleophilaceae bacterium]